MNAIVALCHFCEIHGPTSVFCTQTLRETKLNNLQQQPQLQTSMTNSRCSEMQRICAACTSVGDQFGMVTQHNETNTNFVSTQVPAIPDTVPLIKQAAFRSLSCEVSQRKDGGFVFFGDAVRGHVLSHTFQVRDAQSRGFTKLFSIIILMKDKIFILNVKPFLANRMLDISNELKQRAQQTYEAEQASYLRARRLNAGHSAAATNGIQSRSLAELTGETNIFAYLHTHFTSLLWGGTQYLCESVTLGSPTVPPWVMRQDTEEGFSLVQMDDKEEWLMEKFNEVASDEWCADDEQNYSIRRCKQLLRTQFIAACYSVLVGLQIILRGPQNKTIQMLKCLRCLLPECLHKYTKSDCTRYVAGNDYRIILLPIEVAVPHPCSTIFRVDFIDTVDDNADDINFVSVKWNGELPSKWPAILTKIIKAVDEKLFPDFVLHKHLKLLVEEWKNKILCLKKITSNQDLVKMKKILGIQQQDQAMVNYWMTAM